MIHAEHPLRSYLDKIIKVFPEEQQKEFGQGEEDIENEEDANSAVPGLHEFTVASLEELLKRAKVSIRTFKMYCR